MFDRAKAAAGLIRTHTVDVAGVPIKVPPGVLDPVLFRSGAWFAKQIQKRVEPGMRVLDMGCGSGVVGVLAAKAGAHVVAVDVEPRAVAAALANGVKDVRESDLFSALQGEKFDLIAFNPPYFKGSPSGRLDRKRALSRALYGGPDWEVVRQYGAEVPDHLNKGGVAWACWSDRAQEMPRKLLGREWEEQTSAVIDAELLSLWNRLDPETKRPPKVGRKI